jgi:hypothetical protein
MIDGIAPPLRFLRRLNLGHQSKQLSQYYFEDGQEDPEEPLHRTSFEGPLLLIFFLTLSPNCFSGSVAIAQQQLIHLIRPILSYVRRKMNRGAVPSQAGCAPIHNLLISSNKRFRKPCQQVHIVPALVFNTENTLHSPNGTQTAPVGKRFCFLL